jgi:hypothetical protein
MKLGRKGEGKKQMDDMSKVGLKQQIRRAKEVLTLGCEIDSLN